MEIERNGDDLKPLWPKLRANRLPPGQVLATASPGSPGYEQDFAAAERGETKLMPIEVGKDYLWCMGRGERAPARLRAEAPELVSFVLDERHAEPLREKARIDGAT